MDDTTLFPGITKKKPTNRQPAATGSRHRRIETPEPRTTRRLASGMSHTFPPATLQEETFRHSHWRERRKRVRDALTSAGATATAIDNFDACGSQCQVQWSESRRTFRLSANYCKCRHCEPCARARGNLIARNLRSQLEDERAARSRVDGVGIRFITLTLRHTTAPLADEIRRLMASFKKLRGDRLWKSTQDGGAAVVEVKHSGTGWHAHLHIVSAGRFIDRQKLSDAWHACTGDSFVVDVRALNHVADACHYLCKYVTKGTTPSVWATPDLAQEWITATRSLRVVNTFGSWRGFRLTKPTTGVNDWKPVTSLDALIARAHAGELAAAGILLTLRPPGTSDATPTLPPDDS